MQMKELVTATRSYRRFQQNQAITNDQLRDLVDMARLSASGGNKQGLKFCYSNTQEKNAKVFPHLAWAAALKDWKGPAEGEMPAAYIVILGDTEISKSFGCDQGIAAQSIVLGACEMGIGACMIGSINRNGLREALNVPTRYEILLVIALGKPGEEVVIDEIKEGEDTKYWRDDSGVHHVPKRRLDDVLMSF